MNVKKISAIIIMAIILVVPIYVLFIGKNVDFKAETSTDKSFYEKTEYILKKNFPFNEKLRELAVSLKYYWGEKEQNKIYISDDYLLEVIDEPNEKIVDNNTASIIEFADTYRVPTYGMIIPTACAIEQQKIDKLAQTQLYNQKTFIESIYKIFDGKVSSVNVYPALFANSDKYIYYKTESNLTSLGGYYIYETLAKRLNINPAVMDRFEIEYLNYNYYGDVYEKSPYKEIPPDMLTVYRFWKFRREYKVTSTKNEEQRTYYSLYPHEAAATTSPINIFMGGMADKIDISVASPNETKILIYGDKTALSYIPFLSVNYGLVTFIDIENVSKDMLRDIDIKSYDHVLFAMSADTYMHSDCIKKVVEK
ncbi:MAG: DHHW family protein [Oscillospiraceae bacterium]